MEATNNDKLADALKCLEEAAKDRKDELRKLVSNRYTHLKAALADAEHYAAQTLVAAGRGETQAMVEATTAGARKVRDAATEVDDHVHANPWPYIGGGAVVALLAGYILGRRP